MLDGMDRSHEDPVRSSFTQQRADLEGGRPTGFLPVAEERQIRVTFTHTVVHATKTAP
jgi:hypothetical protein